MKATTPPTRPTLPRWLARLGIPLAIVAGMGLLCFYPLQYLLVVLSAPAIAQNLAPPPYPNAILLNERQFAQGNTGFAIQRRYYTADSPEQVFLYMQGYVENVGVVEGDTEERYYGFRDEQGWIGQQLAEIACASRFCRSTGVYTYPRFGLTFYTAPNDPTGTQIEYEFTYPAP